MATCGDCRFFIGANCVARPPAVRDHGSSYWPRVAAHNWCGEHQPAKPDAAANLALMAEAIAPFVAVANAAAQETGELLITTDLTDDEGEPLNLSSSDFLRLADAYARATGA